MVHRPDVPSFHSLCDQYVAHRKRRHDPGESTRMGVVLVDFAISMKVAAWGDFTASKVCRYMDRAVQSGTSKSVKRAFTSLFELARFASSRYGVINPIGTQENEWAVAPVHRDRRFMHLDEWQQLSDYHVSSEASSESRAKILFTMHPHARRLLYATALQTGYRLRECLSLNGGSLGMTDDGISYLHLDGDFTKNGDPARQYMRPELAIELNKLNRGGDKSLFECGISPLRWKNIGARMLASDMNSARQWFERQVGGSLSSEFLAPVDSRGRHLDFHALRHTCIVWLCQTGASPRTVQTIARHSSIKLTMDRYGHLFKGDEAKAVLNVRVI